MQADLKNRTLSRWYHGHQIVSVAGNDSKGSDGWQHQVYTPDKKKVGGKKNTLAEAIKVAKQANVEAEKAEPVDLPAEPPASNDQDKAGNQTNSKKDK